MNRGELTNAILDANRAERGRHSVRALFVVFVFIPAVVLGVLAVAFLPRLIENLSR